MENKEEEKRMVYGEAKLKISKGFIDKLKLSLLKELSNITFIGEVVCDETTNTPDVIAKNELKAQINFIPTQALEFAKGEVSPDENN